MHGNDHRYGGPDPVPLQPVKWASGEGTVSGATLGNGGATIYVDTGQFITNAPEIFTLDTGQFGSLGLAILADGGMFRIWSSVTYESSGTALTLPAYTYQAGSFFNYVNYCAHLINSPVSGVPIGTGAGWFYTSQHVDVDFLPGGDVVSATPSNVVEFGLTQNTAHGGTYKCSYMVEWLADGPELDFLTYLP